MRELVAYSKSSARVREDPATIRALEEAREELVSVSDEINTERERSQQLQLELEESRKELSELNDKVKSTSLERYTVIYKGIPYHGYWALCAAINRALDVRKIYLELKVNEFYLDFYKGRFSHY